MDCRTLPKVELHLHLDSSLSFTAVSRLDPSVTLAAYQRDFLLPAKCPDMAELFACAPRGSALMQTEEQLRLVTFDVFEQLQRDNVLYAEILLFPYLHTNRGLSGENVVEIVDRAVAQASQEMGIEARIILSVLRHYSTQQSLATVKLVERFKGTRVTCGLWHGGACQHATKLKTILLSLADIQEAPFLSIVDQAFSIWYHHPIQDTGYYLWRRLPCAASSERRCRDEQKCTPRNIDTQHEGMELH